MLQIECIPPSLNSHLDITEDNLDLSIIFVDIFLWFELSFYLSDRIFQLWNLFLPLIKCFHGGHTIVCLVDLHIMKDVGDGLKWINTLEKMKCFSLKN